jgi:catechol 2,3-dioxygenase-like lactoylglutathione lyase family enzyme
MKIIELAFTCYPVTDMARSRAFYEGTLGLVPGMVHENPDGNCWTEYEVAGGCLSLGKWPGATPTSEGASVGLEVDDFDATIAELKAAGVTFKMDAFASPVCRMAIIADPDGNALIIHKRNA